ncbi:hypothetical protein PVAG01_10338 [Phlyctema vagabunda]|uniref:Uncharacterized protein n=1 Tax=Phlyctema vagabunda TaxID=108571 RepID=A0ABR4P5M4_9HELO
MAPVPSEATKKWLEEYGDSYSMFNNNVTSYHQLATLRKQAQSTDLHARRCASYHIGDPQFDQIVWREAQAVTSDRVHVQDIRDRDHGDNDVNIIQPRARSDVSSVSHSSLQLADKHQKNPVGGPRGPIVSEKAAVEAESPILQDDSDGTHRVQGPPESYQREGEERHVANLTSSTGLRQRCGNCVLQEKRSAKALEQDLLNTSEVTPKTLAKEQRQSLIKNPEGPFKEPAHTPAQVPEKAAAMGLENLPEHVQETKLDETVEEVSENSSERAHGNAVTPPTEAAEASSQVAEADLVDPRDTSPDPLSYFGPIFVYGMYAGDHTKPLEPEKPVESNPTQPFAKPSNISGGKDVGPVGNQGSKTDHEEE